MNGKGQVRFSELFTDTVMTHGVLFAIECYCTKGRMADWEFAFWIKQIPHKVLPF